MNLENKEILITGGTGSLGNELTKILQHSNIKGLRIFSRDELKQWKMEQKFPNSSMPIAYHIGDVRDRERLNMALKGVDIVIHAAALKQVPVGEKDPMEVIKTNVYGTENVIKASLHNNVSRVMLISTDKAVEPTNLYGSTKLCAEKLVINAKTYVPDNSTKFSVCRYGNIMGSRGSVIPLFLKQKELGELTITDPKMTRFFTSLPFVANFILNRLQNMIGGEIFIPKMRSCFISDLAKCLAPGIKTKNIGSRQGEKLHEVMINKYEGETTIDQGKYYVIGNKKQENPIAEYSSGGKENLLTQPEILELIKDYVA